MAESEAEQLTIDELARRTSMTVRNIRAHQSRGLLPPPDVRARTGYYGPEHVARIELIRVLQADGYNLDLIRRLLENTDGSSAEVLRFTRALREPFSDEQPTVVTVSELVERWGTEDPKLLERAQQIGLLRPLDGERFEEVSPRLGRAADELLRLGVPAEQALELGLKLRRNADSVATTFARLFVDAVWKPFDAAGRPEERWPEVQEALERLRPLASEAFLAMLQLAMDDVVESEFGRTLDRSGSGRRRRRGSAT